MKIRTDFVTNSSSSSFILGKPDENTHNVLHGIAYLYQGIATISESLPRIPAPRDLYDFLIDLRYSENRDYSIEDIEFVMEVIEYWSDEYDPDIYDDKGNIQLRKDDGTYFQLEYRGSYTREETKAIFDYAYHNYGQILIGNGERPFWPDKLYWEIIQKDESIKYSSNHMG